YFNDITTGYKLKNQYLSKVSCRGGNFIGGISDGVVYNNCNLFSDDFGKLTGITYGNTIDGLVLVTGATIYSIGLETISNQNGVYSINLPAGTNKVTYLADNYITQNHNVIISKNK